MAPKTPTERIEAFKKKDKANSACAACGGHVTTVLMQHNSFVCSRCSGLLREAGFTVKGITMTNWSAADADRICAGGNRKEAQELCAKGCDMSVDRDSDDATVKRFIHAKYVEKRWAAGGAGGGGGGFGTSFTAASGSAPRSGGPPSKEDAQKLARMLPDVSEARASELIQQHGSIEAAVDAYFENGGGGGGGGSTGNGGAANGGASQAFQPAMPRSSPLMRSRTGSRGDRSVSRRRKDKEAPSAPATWDFGSSPTQSPAVAESPSAASFGSVCRGTPIDAPPALLGEADPGRVATMAGMVGMAARNEIPSSSLMQPPNTQQSMWGGSSFASPAYPGCGQGQGFNSAPGAVGCWQQGCATSGNLQTPGNSAFGCPNRDTPPFASNPHNQQQQQQQQQQRQLLQQLLEKKRVLQEQLQIELQKRQLQQQQGCAGPQAVNPFGSTFSGGGQAVAPQSCGGLSMGDHRGCGQPGPFASNGGMCGCGACCGSNAAGITGNGCNGAFGTNGACNGGYGDSGGNGWDWPQPWGGAAQPMSPQPAFHPMGAPGVDPLRPSMPQVAGATYFGGHAQNPFL